MKKAVVKVAFPLVFLLVAGVGVYWWVETHGLERTDNAYVEADIVSVSPKVSGHLRDILVTDNQEVSKGQVLAVIDDQRYASKASKARASVQARQAAMATVDNEIALQGNFVEQADATLESAQAALLQTQQDFNRIERLLAARHVSQKQYDKAQAVVQEASADVRGATAAVEAQRQQVQVLYKKREELQAHLREAEAELALADHDLENTVIYAPIDGVVGNKRAEAGQYVEPGRTLLLVVPDHDLYVVANFKETQISRMNRGQAVTLRFDASPGEVFKGRIDSFAPASGTEFSLLPPQNATGHFTKVVQRVPVKIALVDSYRLGKLLRPGLSVEVTVDTLGNIPPPLFSNQFRAVTQAFAQDSRR